MLCRPCSLLCRVKSADGSTIFLHDRHTFNHSSRWLHAMYRLTSCNMEYCKHPVKRIVFCHKKFWAPPITTYYSKSQKLPHSSAQTQNDNDTKQTDRDRVTNKQQNPINDNNPNKYRTNESHQTVNGNCTDRVFVNLDLEMRKYSWIWHKF